MINETHYPRIEVYSEIDKGDPKAGNDQWTSPSGETVYGGKADYRPHILRKTFLVNEEQKTQLFQITLNWLPYFSLEKENITLEQYFHASADTDRYDFYKMLPHNLGHFFNQKEKDEYYPYYNTLLTYETSYPQEFTIIWLDRNTWFLNNVFYSADGSLSELMQDGQEEIIVEGKFEDFLRLSSIFQYKLTEGFPSIRLYPSKETIPLDNVVLGISLSPGMPNTNSYDIQIAGDASVMQQGFKSNKKINPNKLTAILFEAQKLDWESYRLKDLSKMQKSFAYDRQVFSISVWKDGLLHRVEDPDLNAPSPLRDFVYMVRKIISDEINS